MRVTMDLLGRVQANDSEIMNSFEKSNSGSKNVFFQISKTLWKSKLFFDVYVSLFRKETNKL